MAKVSIIVPVYKVEKYIRQCVDSLINQTLKDIEILLVDDGSPDTCGKICDEYANKDSKVKVIHKQNAGVSAARNDGIKAATGEWIMFVDSDDWATPDMCEIAYNTAIKNKVDIAMFCNFYNYENIELKHKSAPKEIITDNKKDIEIFQQCVFHRGYMDFIEENVRYEGLTAPWSKIFKAELIKNNNISFNLNVRGTFDDGLFMLETLEHAKKVSFNNLFLYHYRKTDTSITQSFKEKQLEVYERIYKEIEKFLEKYNKKEIFREAYYARIILYLVHAIKIYFFNKLNPNNMKQKKNKLKRVIETMPYKEAIKNVDINRLDKTQRIFVFLLKHNLISLVYPVYKVLGVLRNIKNGGNY